MRRVKECMKNLYVFHRTDQTSVQITLRLHRPSESKSDVTHNVFGSAYATSVSRVVSQIEK